MSRLLALFDSYFLSERPTGATIADLDLDLNPKTSIKRLQEYKFTRNDILHYSTLGFFFTFAFIINPLHILIKLSLLSLFGLILLIPFTSQFFLNALPILTWVFFFFTSTGIPTQYRPPISVKILPAMETILYGDNLSQLLATSTRPFLDILAWLPYGLIHFSLPFVVAALVFLWGPPTALRSFAFAFGYMNLIGVIIQILFPAAPPWYKIIHGLDPANYSMPGSPGGLARIDKLIHLDLYSTNFSDNSPVVFGAFPSLHSGSATMDALFLSYLFPKFIPVFVLYVTWLWWSTMYLTHHYFIDVIAGSCLSFIVFSYTKYKHLPINEKDAKNRWSYSEIRKLNIFKSDPLGSSLDNDIENQVVDPFASPVTRARSHSIRTSTQGIELNVVSRQTRSSMMSVPLSTISADDSDSSPESTVFDSDIPRSISRSSNTSIDSQFDMSIPISSAPSTKRD